MVLCVCSQKFLRCVDSVKSYIQIGIFEEVSNFPDYGAMVSEDRPFLVFGRWGCGIVSLVFGFGSNVFVEFVN